MNYTESLRGPIDALVLSIKKSCLDSVAEALGLAEKPAAHLPRHFNVRSARLDSRTLSAVKTTDAQILAAIRSTPNLRADQLAQLVGGNVKPALARLRSAKAVKTKGKRRGMTYTAA